MQEQQASKHPQIKGVVFEDARAVLISAVGRAKKSAKEGQGYRHGGQAGVAGHSLEYPLFVKHQKQPVGRRKQPFVRGASNDPIEPLAVIPCPRSSGKFRCCNRRNHQIHFRQRISVFQKPSC